MAPEAVSDKTFEQRRYEQLRLHNAAKDMGRTAISGYERRRYDEITAGLAEALSGRIVTQYPFELKDGRLVAEDGEPIEEMYLRALRQDIKLASRDAFYHFLPQRSRAELDNFRLMEAMARGETDFNTMIEISPYTEELDTSAENRRRIVKAAQKPYWGRTMVRASHWDGRQVHILTLSSDNLPAAESFGLSGTSSVAMFREAARRQLGYEFKADDSGSMLAEPIKLMVNDGNWQQKPKDLAAEVDRILSVRHGGIWRQGRRESGSIDLQGYVESQVQVLDGLFAAERSLAARYSSYEEYDAAFKHELRKCAALMERRLELCRQDEEITDYRAAADGAGAWADAEGRTYDMCGLVLETSQSNIARQTSSESLLRLMNKKIHCPECAKEVVVPADDLKEGKLSCAECGFWVDVCTGDNGFAEKKAETSKPQGPGGFDIISEALRKYAAESRIRRQAEKQARAELGEKASYLDIKRYEKQILKSRG